MFQLLKGYNWTFTPFTYPRNLCLRQTYSNKVYLFQSCHKADLVFQLLKGYNWTFTPFTYPRNLCLRQTYSNKVYLFQSCHKADLVFQLLKGYNWTFTPFTYPRNLCLRQTYSNKVYVSWIKANDLQVNQDKSQMKTEKCSTMFWAISCNMFPHASDL